MRVLSFKELTDAYNHTNCGFDPGDIDRRNVLTTQYPFAVIVEGGWLELENLDKWSNENINEIPLNQIWYGKLAYDFGCVEYFFVNQENAKAFSSIIPNIYTLYHNSYPPGLICKSQGYDKDILYEPGDQSAIVFN